MYYPFYSKRFEKSYVKLRRSGKLERGEVEFVVAMLASGKKLGPEYQDHALHGEYDGCRECHIRGDILLVYRMEHEKLVLIIMNIGTHSQLFG
jgi:mRNA interferase YafQ